MRAIDRKLLRDFKRLWIQAAAIAIVMACGVAILLTSVGMYNALSETRAAYYERNRFAEVFVHARRAPQSILSEVAAIDGVLQIEARITGYAVLDIPGRIESGMGHIISLPEYGDPLLNQPLLYSGRFPDPSSRDEILVNVPFAEANNLSQGSTVSATLNGRKRELTIVGTALSPEFIYTIGPGSLMPDNETFGVLWMPHVATAAAFDMTGAFNDLSLVLTHNARTEPVIDALDDLLEPFGGLGAHDRSRQISEAFLDAELSQLKGMAMVVPPIFFAIAAFLVSMVMGRIIALERSEIGLLKAVGYSNVEVCLHYLMLAVLIGAAGVVVGWVAGFALARTTALQYAKFFDFPYVIFQVSYWIYAAAALAGLLTTSLGAARSALKAANLDPAIAMQPPAPPRFKRTIIDRIIDGMRLSQPTIMIFRSLLRWPVRSAMTSLGLAFSVATVIATSYITDAMDEIVDVAFYLSNRQDAMVLFSEDVPESAVEDVLDLPGVLVAEGQQFHAAILRNGHLEKHVSIEARHPDADLSRVVDADKRVLTAPPGGVLLATRLAEQIDAQVGDVIEAEFLTGKRETFDLTVVGLTTQHIGLGAYMDQDYLNRLFRQEPRVSTVNIEIDENRLPELHRAIKDTPEISGLIEMNDNRRSFEETIDQNVSVMNGIYIVVAILITIGVAYNGARIQLSERSRELASLRILGFGRGEVSYILVGETMFLAVLAQPAGWLIGTWIASAMTSGFTSDLYAIPLVLTPRSFALGSLVVLIAAFASAMVVRRRLDRLNLVEVMKTRE
ncbi:MAG: ABC transporter permease [Rhodobacteraceae bacterium]|nr:ABC transporter permease [Paracoccaceae bacterium]NNK68731.1 ABC transporter permease [Paracoccaceae bacterium]